MGIQAVLLSLDTPPSKLQASNLGRTQYLPDRFSRCVSSPQMLVLPPLSPFLPIDFRSPRRMPRCSRLMFPLPLGSVPVSAAFSGAKPFRTSRRGGQEGRPQARQAPSCRQDGARHAPFALKLDVRLMASLFLSSVGQPPGVVAASLCTVFLRAAVALLAVKTPTIRTLSLCSRKRSLIDVQSRRSDCVVVYSSCHGMERRQKNDEIMAT